MKGLLVVLGILVAVASASAQQIVRVGEVRFGGQGYSPYRYGHGYYRPVRVIYIGDRVRARRAPSNMPFAYGSFFYGMSWREWQESQNPHRPHHYRGR